jgi:hypothetical protein
LNKNGKILILSIDPKMNEIPTFDLMKKKLNKSLNTDKKTFNIILKTFPNLKIKYFIYRVKILKQSYLKMIKNRYISTLLDLTKKQIKNGLNEIDQNYKKELKFRDQLICFVIEK